MSVNEHEGSGRAASRGAPSWHWGAMGGVGGLLPVLTSPRDGCSGPLRALAPSGTILDPRGGPDFAHLRAPSPTAGGPSTAVRHLLGARVVWHLPPFLPVRNSWSSSPGEAGHIGKHENGSDFESQSGQLLAVGLWASSFTSSGLSFLTCKMSATKYEAPQNVPCVRVRAEWRRVGRAQCT